MFSDGFEVTDRELEAMVLAAPFLEFVFLNGCGTLDMGRRLVEDAKVPVVLAWESPRVPSQHCLTMVCVIL
jgi:hypothetical protein